MADALKHRGPDDFGLWEFDDITLGMRRLSIVDIEAGSQPVFNEDKSVVAVFNGEIYNHVELRKEMERLGHKFRSHHSDSEVIVHLYEEYGFDFLHKLNGMFAIAIWDTKKKQLLLARDRIGVKPLYFSLVNKNLLFASEIKSILSHPSTKKRPNLAALDFYFSQKNIPSPMTAFEGISQLLPGQFAIHSEKGLKLTTWWKINFNENFKLKEEEAALEIRRVLEDSVKIRMQMDVPFGAYLSGGVDSSAVVALMSKNSQKRIKTFCLIYDDEISHKMSDQKYAKKISHLYNTEHYEYKLNFKEVIQSIDEVINAFDEPFSGVTSTYFLTKLISKHVKVALSGDGADELFGSYLSHRLAQPLDYYRGFLKNNNSDDIDKKSLEPYSTQIGYLDKLISLGGEAAIRESLFLINQTEKKNLYTEKMKNNISPVFLSDRVKNIYLDCISTDPLNRALNFDFLTLLPDQVLTFVDRLSMAHSVEVRTPFLDYRLVELCSKIPGKMKIKNGRIKNILKEALNDLLPEDVLNRNKEGFVLPIDLWMIRYMSDFVRDSLSEDKLKSHGLLDYQYVQNLISEHFEGKFNHGPRIWNLIIFQRWWDKFFYAYEA
jgi:asparagine synthase (glutamine-hydrolysing)